MSAAPSYKADVGAEEDDDSFPLGAGVSISAVGGGGAGPKHHPQVIVCEDLNGRPSAIETRRVYGTETGSGVVQIRCTVTSKAAELGVCDCSTNSCVVIVIVCLQPCRRYT